MPKGYIFDYGGTLDTGGQHWGKVLWHAYQRQQVPVTEAQFREAYVHAERTLGRNPVIKPDYTFRQTLDTKVRIEMEYLEATFNKEGIVQQYWNAIVDDVYAKTCTATAHSREVLHCLKDKGCPMVLVSNFYGNIGVVLKEFGLDDVFTCVIESAVVGVRKPDPEIFSLGVEALGLDPADVIVVGDSIEKDIIPAGKVGCHTVWFKGEGWTDDPVDESKPDHVITDLKWLLRLVMLFIICHLSVIPSMAQIFGDIVDEKTGDPIPLASVQYKGHSVGVASDVNGHFQIARYNGWTLSFSAVGYVTKDVMIDASVKSPFKVKLDADNTVLDEVTVNSKRGRYSRKNNPAVEMMKKVIAAKKRTNLDNHDYYQYNKYQKLTLAINDITPAMFDSVKHKKKQWLIDQVEVCPYNYKLILPVSVDETVSQKIFRKQPHDEKIIIKGMNSSGVNDLVQTGDILNTLMKEVFTDVDIYDDQIRMLQYPFTSPIGSGAIAFYRYYIEDTLMVGRDKCFHLHFLPNNQQDFGFRGDLYILADSSWQVKRCDMTIPKKSDVNFVENMQITQEFIRLPNGEWVLSTDDMFTEIKFASFLQKLAVIRHTRITDYAFDELPKQLFKGKKKEVKDVNAMMRGDDFWAKYRQVELTRSESQMDAFVNNLQNIKGFKYIIFGLKALIENFVETGSDKHPSKIDIGPINTIFTSNFIDGFRTRFSAQSTANLDSNFFFRGYAARGWGSKKWYYKGDLIWSFNKKEYLPREFPQRTLTFSSSYDIESPSDKFLHTDKDNVFAAFKWSKVDKMLFYNRQSLTFVREEDWGFRTTVGFKTEEDEAAGSLYFIPLSEDPNHSTSHKFRTTELRAELRFAPGETFINTKQRRVPINLDAPVFTIAHTLGIKGVFGSDYSYNLTEASVYKRFWLRSWGKMDFKVKGGIQWEKVPFPLLIMPETNLSYIIQDYTFEAINNMEFPMDRYVSAQLNWDMNGKLLNRIPLIRKLKWREWIAVRCLWGDLSDKNNPFMEQNAGSTLLMYFPDGAYVINSKKPYWELSIGLHNIFKLIHVEYVRRLNYNELPTAHKHGIRFKVRTTF